MTDESTDSDLVEAILAGNRNAYADLVRRYEQRVRGYCYNMLQNHAFAEDASQEVFIKAYTGLSSFRSEAKFSTWLYRIAYNQCVDVSRKQRREWRHRFFTRSPEGERKVVEASANTGEVSAPMEARQMLQALLGELPEEYRSLLLLREVEGLSYEDLAKTNGSSVNSVKAKLQRARKKLVQIKVRLEKESTKEESADV